MEKLRKEFSVIIVVLAVSLIVSPKVYAGSLEPTGPPTTGTMKTLDQVEPRREFIQAHAKDVVNLDV